MMNLIYLKVAKVGTQNADMTTSIERTVVTLESGKNFDNFVKHLHVQNYIKSEPPTVIKVVEWKDGKVGKEVDKTLYAEQVDNAFNKAHNPGEAIDYKALSEKQSAKISEMEQMMKSFNERLKETEGKKEVSTHKINTDKDKEARLMLEHKAKELNIEYRSNIGDAKLLEKIQAIEPEYNIN